MRSRKPAPLAGTLDESGLNGYRNNMHSGKHKHGRVVYDRARKDHDHLSLAELRKEFGERLRYYRDLLD